MTLSTETIEKIKAFVPEGRQKFIYIMSQPVVTATAVGYAQIICGFLQIIYGYPEIIDKLSIRLMSIILVYLQIICRNPQIIYGYSSLVDVVTG